MEPHERDPHGVHSHGGDATCADRKWRWQASPVLYAERLTVPLRWWVQGTMLVASFWFAVAVAVPSVLAAALVALAFGLLVAAGFLSYGKAKVSVGEGELHAGRAHISLADRKSTRLNSSH